MKIKRSILSLLFLCVQATILAQRYSGYGRGVDLDENLFTIKETIALTIYGVVLYAVGVGIKYLYENKYEDKEWLKKTSYVFKGFGLLPIIAFLCRFWWVLLIVCLLLIVLGYIIYVEVKGRSFGDPDTVEDYKNLLNEIKETIKRSL